MQKGLIFALYRSAGLKSGTQDFGKYSCQNPELVRRLTAFNTRQT